MVVVGTDHIEHLSVECKDIVERRVEGRQQKEDDAT